MNPFLFILDEPNYNGNDQVEFHFQNYDIPDGLESESLDRELESILTSNHQTSKLDNYDVTNVTSYLCPICGKKFLDMKKFRDHCGRSQITAELSCHKCNRQFCNIKFLEQHLLSHSSDPHECPFCSKKFKHHRNLQQHIKTHSKKLKYQCDLCHNEFSCSQNLTRHVKKIHS